MLNHEKFAQGECDTNFITDNPELFDISPKADVELKMLKYIGDKVVNETHGEKNDFDVPVVPKVHIKEPLSGTKQILDEKGPEGLIKWIKSQNKLLLTDTTMRMHISHLWQQE